MSVDHEEVLPEYPLYEVDVDSPEEVEADYGYHSIGKNIQVNNDYMFTVLAHNKILFASLSSILRSVLVLNVCKTI